MGELPLGARDPLEGGVPRLAADGTVSGRGGCGLAVGGSWMVPDVVGWSPGSASIRPGWRVA